METDVGSRCKRQCFSADHYWSDHPRFEILGLNIAMDIRNVSPSQKNKIDL